MMKRVLYVMFFALMGTAFGCAHSGARDSEPALAGSEPSVEALAERFLEAVGTSDAAQLEDLAISYEEFDAIVWPELDANRPGTNLDSRFVWSQYQMRSDVHLRRLLEGFGGRTFRLESINFKGEPREYGGFIIHDDPVLSLIAEDGSRQERQLFGAVIEHDGLYKIYGYSTD